MIVALTFTTIYRWVQEYGKLLYQIWKKKNKKSFYSWKMDETYIKIKGKWHYLYRAIDADGLTLDIWLRKKRDTQAAYAFLKRLHKQFGEPRVIVTDKAPSIGSAFRKLQSNGLYTKTGHGDHSRNIQKNRRNGTLFGFSVSSEIKILMGISA